MTHANYEVYDPEPEDYSYFLGEVCVCGDLLESHSLGKCYALHFDGFTFIACPCTNEKVKPFEIILIVPNEMVN